MDPSHHQCHPRLIAWTWTSEVPSGAVLEHLEGAALAVQAALLFASIRLKLIVTDQHQSPQHRTAQVPRLPYPHS
jgi:hypothetical protein